MRRGVVVVLLVFLAACGGPAASTGDDDPAADSADTSDPTDAPDTTTLVSADGAVSAEVPAGWVEPELEVTGPVALVAQSEEDELDQLIVNTYTEPGAAEEQAISITAGLASSDVSCERTELDGQLLFDCPEDQDGGTVRRMYAPLTEDGSSLLVLVQTRAETLADAADLLGPILDGIAVR
ncbi:hypothetical protein ACHAAC_16295 [Aeromicrobium sp. CF4.19]|uniref:hypothetical protein n=1 Tax=Aeromicrobium sp. CF4.19 TaxID=3373082 RepID=UPI003EE68958